MSSDPALGIDFGTSTTVGVLRRTDGTVRPLLFDGTPLLPSAVYLEPSGRLLTGRDAIHAARLDPSRFEPSPKARIGEGTVLLGAREIDAMALATAVLRRVAVEATRVNGTAVPRLTLTHPASWGSHRRAVLVEAAHHAGLPRPHLVAEPVAAASYFTDVLGNRIRPGSAVVVYDFGAGTFDASVVIRGERGFDTAMVDGLDTGGLDIDAAIVDWLGSRYAQRDPAAWQRLLAPTETADRRAREQLWTDVRACKEQLSRESSARLAVPLLDVEAHLTRTELEDLARPLVDGTVRATAEVIRHAKLGDGQIAGVFLVGGSSRLPLVAAALHRALGVASTIIEQPEVVVGEGSLRVPADDTSTTTRILPVLSAPPAPALTAPAVPRPSTPLNNAGAPAGTSPAPVSPGPVPSIPASPGPVPASRGAVPNRTALMPAAGHPGSTTDERAGDRAAAPAPYRATDAISGPGTVPAASRSGRGAPAPAYGMPPGNGATTYGAATGAPSTRRSSGGGRQALLAALAVVLLVILAGVGWYGYQHWNRPVRDDRPDTQQTDGRPGFVPASWSLAVASTGARNGWHENASVEGATCRLADGRLSVSKTRPGPSDTGMFACGGAATIYRDVALDTTMELGSGCAGVWMRTGDERGYFLEVCDGMVSLHLVSSADPSATTALSQWRVSARLTEIGVLVRGTTISVYANGTKLGEQHDSRVRFGRVDLGVFAPDTEATATFSATRVWHPAS